MDKLYTISEVAEKLNLTPKTLRRWEDSGKFTPSRTLGGQRRYSLLDLQILDAIKHNTIPSSSDLLTIDTAAALFGVSTATITRWENEGRIHPLITAGITYYPRHRLLEKMSELQQTNPSDELPLPSYPPISNSELALPTYIHSHTPPNQTHNPTPTNPRPSLTPLNKSDDSSPRPVKTPPSHPFPSDFHTPSFVANLTVTLILILTYHLIFINPNTSFTPPLKSPSSSPLPLSGSVQGSATSRDPSLVLLDSILDKTGALTNKTSLTTPLISLTPSTPPSTPIPGTLYFDAGSQTLKLFTTVWTDLPGPKFLQLTDTKLISGTGTILKDKNSVTINHEGLNSDSSISLTFHSDYAPAKKYWLTTSPGAFTVHTDFPVSSSASFSYLILTPNPASPPNPESTTGPTPSSSPSPTPPLIEETTP